MPLKNPMLSDTIMPMSILFATHTHKKVCRTSLAYCANCALPLFFPFITEACTHISMYKGFVNS